MNDRITHAYVHRLADVHLAGFAPAFTLSLCDSEYARKPPVPIASVVMGKRKKNKKHDYSTNFISMRRTIIKSFIFGLILVLAPTTVKSQLFVHNELFPEVKSIKGKYYNGSGSGRYWSLDYVDSIGRVIKKESYRNNQLMSRNEIKYDNQNNILFDIQTFDFNNPARIDTFKYEYKYSDNRITYQYRKLSVNDSTVIELIKNEGDSIYRYQEKAFYFRPNTGKTDVYETIYTLRFKNSLLISNEIFDPKDNSKEIKTYEYFDNGRLKRRTIKRIPEPELKGNYCGGLGSDDEYYKYDLDSHGKIKKFFRIINGKTYKIATYKYN